MPLPTLDEVMEAVEDSYSSCGNPGFCTECGERQDGCEPDARNYECDCCGAFAVCGAEEILISGKHA